MAYLVEFVGGPFDGQRTEVTCFPVVVAVGAPRSVVVPDGDGERIAEVWPELKMWPRKGSGGAPVLGGAGQRFLDWPADD